MTETVTYLRHGQHPVGKNRIVVEERVAPAGSPLPEGGDWTEAPAAVLTRLYARFDETGTVTEIREMPTYVTPEGDGWVVAPKGITVGWHS